MKVRHDKDIAIELKVKVMLAFLRKGQGELEDMLSWYLQLNMITKSEAETIRARVYKEMSDD